MSGRECVLLCSGREFSLLCLLHFFPWFRVYMVTKLGLKTVGLQKKYSIVVDEGRRTMDVGTKNEHNKRRRENKNDVGQVGTTSVKVG